MRFSEGGGKVHKLIREILTHKGCLRRHEIYSQLTLRGHFEGDTGKRLREMSDIWCNETKAMVDGKMKRVWLYSLVVA